MNMAARMAVEAPALRHFDRFNQEAWQRNVPLSGGLDLTRRCNLRCRHCYLGGEDSPEAELTTEQWTGIIGELAEAGCLFLLITGGEPLLRPDFPAIYRHAKQKGMVVTVFTNGTLVTEAMVRLFRDWPPHEVEVSIYAATPATHDRVTGVEGSFEQAWQGIRQLLGAGVRLKLKTVLMTMNQPELEGMRALALEAGVPFRFDPAIFPCLQGDARPVELRVEAKAAVEAEFADGRVARQYMEYYQSSRNRAGLPELFTCGAGRDYFHIDAAGRLHPCLMVPGIAYDLTRGTFGEGWRLTGEAVKGRPSGDLSPCRECDKSVFCGYCPGFFAMETGDATCRSEYLCEMGRYRFEKTRSIMEG